MLLAGRLDLLALGDDAASVLGLNVRRTRMTTMLVAVLLSAAAVTLAGPIGFVGLSAPVIVRLVGRRVPVLLRHRWLLPASMVTGVVVVVGSDVLLRTVFGPMAGVTVPTGVPTSILGAVAARGAGPGVPGRQRLARPVAGHEGRDAAPGRRDAGGDRRAARRRGGRRDAPRRHQGPAR